MTIRDLKVFIAVCDSGGITAAAEKLMVTQPSVSQTISALEHQYQLRLFERYAKRLYLTETGRKFLQYARHVVTSFNEMENIFKTSGSGGVIRVGVSVTVGTCILPKLVKAFMGQRGNTQIEAVMDNTSIIEDYIMTNEVDLGLVEGNVHLQDIACTPFMDDEVVFVCGREHPLYGGNLQSADELSGLKLVVREKGSGTRELLDMMMTARQIRWRPHWVFNGSDGIKNAAMAGIGVAVLSQRLVEKEIVEGELWKIRVEDFHLKRKFSIIHHRNKFMSQNVKDFINLCYNFNESQ